MRAIMNGKKCGFGCVDNVRVDSARECWETGKNGGFKKIV